MRFFVAFFFMQLALTAQSAAQSVWEYEYSKADKAGQISSCNASIYFKDGAVIARIHGEWLDFFFQKSSFALPRSEELGKVAFVFKTQTFVLSAFSGSANDSGRNTVSHMFLTPAKNDYARILENMRLADSFGILFPDETSYSIPLRGSNQALEGASNCWSENVTGTLGENPFNGSQPSGENPFN